MRLSLWIVEMGMPRADQGGALWESCPRSANRAYTRIPTSLSPCSEAFISKVHGYVLILTNRSPDKVTRQRGDISAVNAGFCKKCSI